MTAVFFYGLFMDAQLLREKGFSPSSQAIAWVHGYGLRIGARATLIPSAGERAYGVVMELEDEEISDLYADASVADYLPEQVVAVTDDERRIEAVVYNLPEANLSGRNADYLDSLIAVTRKIGLPEDYIAELEEMKEPD